MASALLGHADVEQMAQAIKIVNIANDESSPSYSSLYPKPTFEIEGANFSSPPRPPIESSSDDTRPIVKYNGSNIIIDWQYHDKSDGWRKMNPDVFRHRTESLAQLLNYVQKMGLSTLHCVGYVNIEPSLTGYGFRIPQGVNPQTPLTLHKLLRSSNGLDMPDLAERFDLARALVDTVFKIHSVGWVHRNLLPRNILFWCHSDALRRCDINKPYVVGFDIAGPSQSEEYSERPATHFGDEFYRHHDYQRIGGQQHVYDVYSLGVILFEIGFWRPIDSIFKDRKPDPRSAPETLRKQASALRGYVGRRYVDAALACIDGSLEGLWAKHEGYEQQVNHLNYFASKIVDVIAPCNV
ncbi:hypothetical protein G7Y79_00030g064610 [Physcia stellaris]|nr:hypothetical protein G7Y79_00030g064610 [Physcia stellaris]